MKYRLNPYILTALLTATLTFFSCEDDWLENIRTDSSQYICFDTEILDVTANASTRCHAEHLMMESEEWKLVGTTTNSATRVMPTKNLLGEAGVIGYKDSETSPMTEFDDISYTFENEAMRATNAPIPWSRVNNVNTALHLFAYAPYSVVHGESPEATLDNTTATPKLTYTVPDGVDDQIDLIVANTDVAKANFGRSIPLTFDHILTAIRFKVDFPCKVKSLTVNGVYNIGTYTYGSGWSNQTNLHNYGFGESYFTADGQYFETSDYLNRSDNTLILMPQTVPAEANVQLVYSTDDGANWQTLTASIAGHEWQPGKRVTYTLSKSGVSYIYFDLALGSVTINASSYSGKIRVSDGSVATVSGTHKATNAYYVYQSSSTNRSSTGWSTTTVGTGTCAIPTYAEVTYNGKPWKQYITNNQVVEDIITNWPVAASAQGRESTIGNVAHTASNYSSEHHIDVTGAVGTCDLTIDNIYTRYQEASVSRTKGSVTYLPAGSNNTMTLTFVGDNRLSNIHYYNSNETNQLIIEGPGSLTVADPDNGVYDATGNNTRPAGYCGNYWNSAIGGNDSQGHVYGLVFNSGYFFVGTTAADQCTAIGAGGNDPARITINGGTITAVATTTGTAIGGGIGFNSSGGTGKVTITGGNIYAYNHRNRWNIPSAAIGGAGSQASTGATGEVTITGGNVYAYTALGTAIGGGSSQTKRGGNAVVNISGGNVIAKSIAYLTPGESGYIPAGCGIGGGTGCSGGGHSGSHHGGSANITISGGNVWTGSIGGGATGDDLANIGSAKINIIGGDIQAQFVMEAGASSSPSFTMTGGRIRNSHAADNSEYENITPYGGAVYIEDGTFTMSGGTIENCSATKGGAVFIRKNGSSSPSFIMSGGATIKSCSSTSHGGCVYLEGGNVTINNGTIDKNRSSDSGGGVYVSDGSFTMTDGDITDNYAATNGGGVAVASATADAVTVNIEGGSITGNSCGRYGGGLSVMPGDDAAIVTLGADSHGLTNPDISNNKAIHRGGGVYTSGELALITINSGKVKNNIVSALVANPDVANDGGLVLLNKGDVTHVVVTYHMNDGSVPETTSTQNIVTATRSRLSAPSWSHPISGYTFSGWNTKADGSGTSYANGQEVNLTAGLHLYATWIAP